MLRPTLMWQRKQTVFLAIASLLAAATWLFPVAEYDVAGARYTFLTQGITGPDGTTVEEVATRIPFQWVLTALAVILVVCIFLYGDRPRQMRIVRGTYLLTLLSVAFLFITDNSLRAWLGGMGEVQAHYGVSFFLPLAVLPFTFLAERAIRKDEALVRAMDRLR